MSDIEATATTPEVPAEPALKSVDTKPATRGFAPPADPIPEPPKEEPAAAEQQEASEEAVAGDEVEDHANPADEPKKKRPDKLPRWVQERMERVKRVAAAEAREQLLREFQSQLAPKQPEVPGATLADFNFDQEAFIAHKVEERIQQREAQTQREAEERQQAQQAEQFKSKVDAFEERAGAGAWDELIHSPVNSDPTLKALTDVFMGDDNDLDLAAHFAENLDDAYRIAALPPLQRAREVAKVADTLAQPAKPAQPPKKITTAPPPPTQVQGIAKPAPSEDDPDITPAQRIALWQAKRKR